MTIGIKGYQDTETYWDKEEQPLSYYVSKATYNSSISFSLGVYVEGFVTVQNTDTVPGTYDVYFTFKTLRRTLTDSERLYISPGQSQTAHGIGDIDVGEDYVFSYNVTPGTKIVDVQRERTVWRERPVTHYKEVPLLSFD